MTTEHQSSAEIAPTTEPAEVVTVRPARRRLRVTTERLEQFGLPIIFVAVVILFSIMRPDTFATVNNWRSIAET
jgi:ribose transport system permease protein